MRKRVPEFPIDPKDITPPPAWQVPPKPVWIRDADDDEAPEIDPPELPEPERIRRREFPTVRRGYDSVQVRAYLKTIADVVARLPNQDLTMGLPVKGLRPNDIRRREFSVVRRGYDQEDVREYLTMLGEALEAATPRPT